MGQEDITQSERIRLRVVTRADLALLEAWEDDPAFYSEFNSFGLRPPGVLERRFEQDGLLTQAFGRLLIATTDGTLIGDMSYHEERYGPNTGSVAYNIGINIAVAQRGKGYGVEAQQLLAAYLFSTYPVIRIEALTDIENKREQRALEKASFTREGVLRQAQWRNGHCHDLVMYSKLRGE